jgi:adenylate cyclase
VAAYPGGLDLVPDLRRACLGHESFVIVIVLCFPVALVSSWAFEITPEGIKRESDIDPGKSSATRTGRRIVSLTAVLAVIAAALFIFQLFRSKILTTTTAESIQKAISFAQDAVRLDPGYALAYAKLSQAWRQYGASFAVDNAEKAYQEARVAAEKAASLAPDLVEVRKAIGWIAMTPALDFRAAEKEFRRALELSPGDAGAKNALSYSLMAQGRLAEAEQTCREAILLDPLVTVLWYNLGRLAVAAGRYQDAEEMFRKGLEIQPHAARFHTYLSALDIVQRNPTAALQQAQLEPDGFWRQYALTLVQQTQPDRAAADTALKNFSTKYASNGAYQIAVIHALRKEPDEMFRWLDNAYATHDSGLTQLVITPFVFEYRDDPRLSPCAKNSASSCRRPP